MTGKEVAEFYGSKRKAAIALEITTQTIENWCKPNKEIPRLTQIAIEYLTDGKLRRKKNE